MLRTLAAVVSGSTPQAQKVPLLFGFHPYLVPMLKAPGARGKRARTAGK